MHRIAVPHLETVNPEAGMAKPVQNQEQNNNIDDETPKDTKLSENFRGGGCDTAAGETAVVSDHTEAGRSAASSLQMCLRGAGWMCRFFVS